MMRQIFQRMALGATALIGLAVGSTAMAADGFTGRCELPGASILQEFIPGGTGLLLTASPGGTYEFRFEAFKDFGGGFEDYNNASGLELVIARYDLLPTDPLSLADYLGFPGLNAVTLPLSAEVMGGNEYAVTVTDIDFAGAYIGPDEGVSVGALLSGLLDQITLGALSLNGSLPINGVLLAVVDTTDGTVSGCSLIKDAALDVAGVDAATGADLADDTPVPLPLNFTPVLTSEPIIAGDLLGKGVVVVDERFPQNPGDNEACVDFTVTNWNPLGGLLYRVEWGDGVATSTNYTGGSVDPIRPQNPNADGATSGAFFVSEVITACADSLPAEDYTPRIVLADRNALTRDVIAPLSGFTVQQLNPPTLQSVRLGTCLPVAGQTALESCPDTFVEAQTTFDPDGQRIYTLEEGVIFAEVIATDPDAYDFDALACEFDFGTDSNAIDPFEGRDCTSSSPEYYEISALLTDFDPPPVFNTGGTGATGGQFGKSFLIRKNNNTAPVRVSYTARVTDSTGLSDALTGGYSVSRSPELVSGAGALQCVSDAFDGQGGIDYEGMPGFSLDVPTTSGKRDQFNDDVAIETDFRFTAVAGREYLVTIDLGDAVSYSISGPVSDTGNDRRVKLRYTAAAGTQAFNVIAGAVPGEGYRAGGTYSVKVTVQQVMDLADTQYFCSAERQAFEVVNVLTVVDDVDPALGAFALGANITQGTVDLDVRFEVQVGSTPDTSGTGLCIPQGVSFNFGDGTTIGDFPLSSTGRRSVVHTYTEPNALVNGQILEPYEATATVTYAPEDPITTPGTACPALTSAARLIYVLPDDVSAARLEINPLFAEVDQDISFDMSKSVAAVGETIQSYTLTFGDSLVRVNGEVVGPNAPYERAWPADPASQVLVVQYDEAGTFEPTLTIGTAAVLQFPCDFDGVGCVSAPTPKRFPVTLSRTTQQVLVAPKVVTDNSQGGGSSGSGSAGGGSASDPDARFEELVGSSGSLGWLMLIGLLPLVGRRVNR